MRIFSASLRACSISSTRRPRCPICAAHIIPAAPAPMTMASQRPAPRAESDAGLMFAADPAAEHRKIEFAVAGFERAIATHGLAHYAQADETDTTAHSALT